MPCPANTYSPTGTGDSSECAGFVLRVYNLDPDILVLKLPNISTLVPIGIAYVNSINVPDGLENQYWLPLVPSTRNFNFAATFSGSLKISKAGNYTFCSRSDDGSTLTVDGALLVDIQGTGPLRRACGDAKYLAAGAHSIYVAYFDFLLYAGITASYRGPDTGGVEVVIQSPAKVIARHR